MDIKKITFALYFANRGFFPERLIAGAREEMTQAVTQAGYHYIMMESGETRNGAIETAEEGRKFAKFLEENKGKFDGVILSLPNFGDENGAVPAMLDANVPVLIQAYPDEIGKMDFDSRRDSYCGKFSIMDMFYQYGIKYTAFPPHVIHPGTNAFQRQLEEFAGVCRVVKSCKRFTIGAIGARTTAFKTVRWDEVALQKYGVQVDSYDLSELFSRVKGMNATRDVLSEKKNFLKGYTNFSSVPDSNFDTIARVSVAIDDMMKEYSLDTVSLRCWTEMQSELNIAPCVILSELNDRGIAASCEMDVCNTVAMHALTQASNMPSACLDWNNNYGDDPDKVILFHCGPIPQSLMTCKGLVTDHKMFVKAGGANCGWGCNEGRIAPMEMTYASVKTGDGKIHMYAGEGTFTSDPIEDEFFGCGGVAKINDLQDKLLYIGKNGFRHHVCATQGHVLKSVEEGLSNYLGYELKVLK